MLVPSTVTCCCLRKSLPAVGLLMRKFGDDVP